MSQIRYANHIGAMDHATLQVTFQMDWSKIEMSKRTDVAIQNHLDILLCCEASDRPSGKGDDPKDRDCILAYKRSPYHSVETKSKYQLFLFDGEFSWPFYILTALNNSISLLFRYPHLFRNICFSIISWEIQMHIWFRRFYCTVSYIHIFYIIFPKAVK